MLQYSCKLIGEGCVIKKTNETNFNPEDEPAFEEAQRKGLLPTQINRFSDHFLKFLLANPKRKWLLLDLINTILILMGYEPLADIRPMDRELSPDRPAGKG
ncbi:MAG: hypothetical protein LBQ90_00505, partial [Synergistaceae bacterium]|nr:hypothetical protein [Synergistaceae bacterium]